MTHSLQLLSERAKVLLSRAPQRPINSNMLAKTFAEAALKSEGFKEDNDINVLETAKKFSNLIPRKNVDNAEFGHSLLMPVHMIRALVGIPIPKGPQQLENERLLDLARRAGNCEITPRECLDEAAGMDM